MQVFARAAWAAGTISLLAAAGVLVGCSSNPNAGNPCPTVVAAPGADAIFLFGPGGHERKDVIIAARVLNAHATCTREPAGLAVDTQIEFYAERVSNMVKDTELPYFVALVDPAQRVLVQQAYQVPIQFLPGEGYRRVPPEKVTVHLPVRDRTTAPNYAVVVGFSLTPDQLAFNRSIASH
jgi:hypothetical protein